VNLIKSVAKFLVVAWVAYLVIAPRMGHILMTMRLPMAQAMDYFHETLFLRTATSCS